jgi:hypothetical protein
MTGWNGCVGFGGTLRRSAAMIYTPSTNIIARRRHVCLIEAIEMMLLRTESKERFPRMAKSILPASGDLVANAV